MPPESKRPVPGRRRQRLSDNETTNRMLTAAYGMITESGLHVIPANVPMEDVIRRADVSRTAVYRRWPYKDLFYSDLLLHVARTAPPPELAAATRHHLASHLDERAELATRRQRHDFAVDLVRRGAELDFTMLRDAPQWRTYIALHAAAHSLPDEKLRHQVLAALSETERHVNREIGAAYENFADILGYRLSPGTKSFWLLATRIGATMRGFVLTAFTNPAHSDTTEGSFFGTSYPVEWSQPAFAVAAIVFNCLEPDPTVRWDSSRIATLIPRIRAELTNMGS